MKKITFFSKYFECMRKYLYICSRIRNIELFITKNNINMALLKEDGSLDIERINQLPIEEYIQEIESLSKEQYKDYFSKLPINESKQCTKAIEVDYTLEEELKRGAVIAEDFLNKQREKYCKKR